MIKGRHRRENHRPHPRERNHRLQMAEVKRRLSNYQDELFPLFEDNVGRAHQKVAAQGVGDSSHGLHRTRGDHHSRGAKGAAGNARADVVDVVDDVRQCFDVLDRIGRLDPNGHLARLGQDQMGLDIVELGQDLENPHTVDRAGGTGDTNDQFFLVTQWTNSSVNESPSCTPRTSFSRTGAMISILSCGYPLTSGTSTAPLTLSLGRPSGAWNTTPEKPAPPWPPP